MLVKNNVDNHMYVWSVNTTNDTLQGIDLGAHWSGIKFLTSGHFAGSGDEMLIQNSTDHHVYMWWVNGNHALSSVDLGAVAASWQVVATADYNADGYTDIVWHNSQTGDVQLWLMDNFSGPTNSTAAAASTIDVTSDVVALGTVHQPATIEVGATFELRDAESGTVTFAGSTGTLLIDHAATFNGQVLGLSGNGNPSQSDVIDLKDIAFGLGTRASYVGTSVDGTLTVSDAQGDATNISLIGNHQNTTFSASSDGAGGTLVVDPAATGLPLEGQFVFNNLGAVGKASVSVSEQNGGAGYVGSFTADALATTDGRKAIDWQFDPAPNSVQHITQSYNMSVGAPGSGGNGSSASQSLSVTIGGPGSDTFVFKPGFGTDVIADLKASEYR